MSAEWRKVNLVCRPDRRRRRRSTQQPLPVDAARAAGAVRPRRADQVPDRRGAGDPAGGRRPDELQRAVPGLARRRHRRRARGLHGRGQRGRGRPRHHPPAAGHPDARPRRPLELQGRQVRLVLRRDQRPPAADVHDPDVAPSTEDETITVTPLRAFPVIRDLVTDVSFNYAEGAGDAGLRAAGRASRPGEYRMQQVDVERSQEFRKCIECFLCQNTCHVVRDHEENKPAFAGPRFFIRVAELDMHPLDADGPQATRRRTSTASATATSPSAAPRSAPSTSRSPTTRSSR